jgi:hypothetical protein
MRMKYLRPKRETEPKQSNERTHQAQWISAILYDELMSHAVPFEQLQIVAPGARINDLVSLLCLAAGQVDGDVSIPVTVVTVVDEVNNSHS